MATETEGTGYLQRLLADGARPFRFRAGVRKLLGLPDSSSVEVSFPRPLPASGFAYVLPRFSGEFEFPDELIGGSRRPGERVEEIDFSGSWMDLSGDDSVPAGPSARTSAPPSSSGGETGAAPAHTFALPDERQQGARSSPFTPSTSSALAARPLPIHELVIPDLRQLEGSRRAQSGARPASAAASEWSVAQPIDSIPAAPEASTRALRQPMSGEPHPPGKTAQAGAAGPAEPTPASAGQDIVATPRSLARSIPGGLSEARIPSTLHVPSLPSERLRAQAGSAAAVEPASAGSGAAADASIGSPDSRSDFSPRSATSAPLPDRTARTAPATANVASSMASMASMASVASVASKPRTNPRAEPRPAAAGAGKARDPFEPYRPGATAAPAQTFAAPPATPPVVLVQPAVGPGMAASTPAAFWERRHLTHLKLRLRR